MIVRRGYKFRLKPDAAQHSKLHRAAGCCRYAWNELLTVNKHRESIGLPLLSYGAMCRLLTALKRDKTFLANAYSNSLQQSLRDLATAYERAHNPKLNSRAPRYKRRNDKPSFRYPAGYKLHGSAIYLPKIGWLSFYRSRPLPGRTKSVTVSFDGQHWFISILVELECSDAFRRVDSCIGIDLGIERFAALSDGTFIDAPNAYRKYLSRLRFLQRRMSRKKTYSNNWQRARRRLAKLHRRIANIRRDALHKASTFISKTHAMIVMEDLHVLNLLQSAQGTLTQPGSKVRAKAALNRRIGDQGWAEFRRYLTYKAAYFAGGTIFVPAQNTSLRCSRCHFQDIANRKTQHSFGCLRCGHFANADTNAAINILRAGQAQFACGDLRLRESLKQEAQLAPLVQVDKSQSSLASGSMPNHAVPMPLNH